ncbi:hypothetical protein [Halocatena halophila]|uniref:hypothetical protein n=1 Tax=Halocatena halophila TaxID=2814576 RepID=UPI002ED4FD64
MKDNNTGVKNSTDNDESYITVPEDKFYQLIEEVKDLQKRVGRVEDTEEENKRLRERVEDLEQENDELRDQVPDNDLIKDLVSKTNRITDLEEEIEEKANGKQVEAHHKKLKHIQDTLDDLRQDILSGDNSDTTETDAPDHHSPRTPIERLLEDPKSSGVRITKSVDRALTILGYFPQWSKKSVGGRVIAPSETNLLDLMNTARSESLSWKQIHRACAKLEDLSNGIVEWVKDQDAGRCLRVKDESFLTNVVSG